jgi:3-oxoadipate enol-lactonase
MIRESRVEIGGRSMEYLESGVGWPVVLLHGFPLTADMWRPQLERVPDGWQYIAPDLRTVTRGAISTALPPTMDDFADRIAAFMDALEIERAVIGGLSMGGYITFALFRRAPDRFSGMILADTRPQPDTSEGRQARHAMLELVHTKGAPAVADQMIPRLLSEITRRERPELAAEVRRMIEANERADFEGAIHAMLTRPDSTGDLSRIACATLVIVGEDDAVTPVAESEKLQRALARSHLVVLGGAGHLSNLEAPEAFARALADFLASNL